VLAKSRVSTRFLFSWTPTLEKMKQFWKKLLTYDEVIEVHIISGQYDLLAVLELDLREKPLFTTVKNLAQKAVRKIRKLGGVRDTNTFVPFLSVTKRVE
jgi:DNA-binding Lrp family transcriptional regulator